MFWHLQRLWHQKLYLNRSVMPKPVSFLTVQEAHKEYSSLTDQIRAKYEQLDSGEFGSPGTPAFHAEACELANLFAHVSQLCHRLNLPMPKELYRPTFFQVLKTLFVWRVWRMQLCSHRYGRIIRLLNAPLDLRIVDWLCILPAITLVVVKSKKVNKAASSDWLVVNH